MTNGAIITATATNDAGSTSKFGTIATVTDPVTDNLPSAADDAYSVAQDTTLAVDWWDTDWTKRRQLNFNNLAQATDDLTDYPVLLKLQDGVNIEYADTQANGEDLRFFDADGTALAYEIEEWNESGTSYVWVRVPQIDKGTNADYITMYYGNGSALAGESPDRVWTDNFAFVHHLEETSGTHFDSSSERQRRNQQRLTARTSNRHGHLRSEPI